MHRSFQVRSSKFCLSDWFSLPAGIHGRRGPTADHKVCQPQVSIMSISKVWLRGCCAYGFLVSLRCASGSDQLQLFVKEQERNKLLCLSHSQLSTGRPSAPAASSTSQSTAQDDGKSPPSGRKQKAGKRGRAKDVEEDAASVGTVDAAEEGLEKEVKPGRKAKAKRKAPAKANAEEFPPENPVTQPSPGEPR